MDAVGADHFHMLANVFEAAHDLLLVRETPAQRFVCAAGSNARRPPTLVYGTSHPDARVAALTIRA
jgi:hypothetical protein